jgi:hypothetical protein
MSLFKKKPTIPEGLTNALLPGGRTVDVVGESHYQEALELITGGKTEEAHDLEKWASLIREPDNPYDRNAVAVYIDGRKVGYLSRDDAPQYGVLLDELWQKYHLRGACRANICGGLATLRPHWVERHGRGPLRRQARARGAGGFARCVRDHGL